jgi:hypothetical protein
MLFENFQAFSGHSFLNQIWRNVPEPLLLVRIRIFLLPTTLFLFFYSALSEKKRQPFVLASRAISPSGVGCEFPEKIVF